jgi:uncharacterized membrane protein
VGALIGLSAAGEEGAELALAELARTGAFDRSHLLLVRRQVWLADGQRGRGVPEHMHWRPLITFVQTAMDAANAMVSVPGEFGSFGHDYRATWCASSVTPIRCPRIKAPTAPPPPAHRADDDAPTE